MQHIMKTLLIALLSFSMVGCAASVPQPTMEELLAEVNAEHQNVGNFKLVVMKKGKAVFTVFPFCFG